MKHLFIVTTILACLGLAQGIFADDLNIKSGDTIQKVLESQRGKRITVQLTGNGEITGKVITVTKELVQLSEISNAEFFNSVIEISKISAVIVRVK